MWFRTGDGPMHGRTRGCAHDVEMRQVAHTFLDSTFTARQSMPVVLTVNDTIEHDSRFETREFPGPRHSPIRERDPRERLAHPWRRFPVEWMSRVRRRRSVLFFMTGALCAGGLWIALLTPSDSSDRPAAPMAATPTVSPARKLATNVDGVSAGTETDSLGTDANAGRPADHVTTDPRAFVIERALAGEFDVSGAGWSDASAQVASRNGDVVLVYVHATTPEGEKSLHVLLVQTKNAWVIRETYPDAES